MSITINRCHAKFQRRNRVHARGFLIFVITYHRSDVMMQFRHLVTVILSFCSPVWATALLCLCGWTVPFLHLIVVLYKDLYNIIVVPSTRCTVPTSHHLSPQSHIITSCMLHTANAIVYHRVDQCDCDQNCMDILSLILSRSRSTSVENTEQKNREISVPFLWYKNALKTYYY